ncbi:MAG TPA: hypothetical protein VFW96_16205 [Thermomicrobiales bacterium]|nr:hypothetical protein [Thermomicrobiales bacterium]
MVSSHSLEAGPGAATRRGLWLLPLAGIILAVVTLLWLVPLPGATANATLADQARMMASPLVLIVFGWLYFVGLIVLILGLQALYGVLAAGHGRAWALGGLALGVAGAAVLLAAFGAVALGGAVVAGSYLGGNTGAADAMQHLQGGSFGAAVMQALVVAIILAVAGAIAEGVAIWRSGTLPRWAAIVFGVGLVLVAASTPLVTTLGGLLLLASGVAIARATGREAIAGEAAPAALQPA